MPPKQDDDQQDRVAGDEQQRDERAEADEPHPRRHRGHRAAAVERHDGQQVEEVEEEADVGERAAAGRCRWPRRSPGTTAAPSVPRIGPASPTRASASALSPSDFASDRRRPGRG